MYLFLLYYKIDKSKTYDDQTMTITINNEPVVLVYSFRSNIFFEQLTGKSLDFQNLKGDDILNLFYSVVVASMQKERKEICSFLDFLDAIDAEGGDECLVKFANWYVDVLKKQYEALTDKEEKKPQGPQTQTGKKN